jgi:putative hydroxymethylpyrimidine transport system substrate-binding protein
MNKKFAANRRIVVTLFLSAAFVLLSSCRRELSTPRPTQTAKPLAMAPLREVRVRLDWTPWVPHAAFYAADRLGYFREEGLHVSMYVPPDPEATTHLVAQGRDDFGISYMTDTILAREQGFKVVSVAAIVPHPLNCIMTLKKSGIVTPRQLLGKTIGTTGVASDDAFLDWIFDRNAVPRASVRRVNIGFNLAPALKSGKVSAIVGAYWPWEGIKLDQEGFPVNVMKLQEYGVPDYYELILITRDDLAARDPQLVRKLLHALAKGDRYVSANPDEAVEILGSVSRDLSPAFLTSAMHAMLPLIQRPRGRELWQDGRQWSEMVQFMVRAGLVKRPPDARSLYSNDFLSGGS